MLRSMNDLKGYQIQATDGTIGHVQGFLVDGAQGADCTAMDRRS
jgi:hypothetical protein